MHYLKSASFSSLLLAVFMFAGCSSSNRLSSSQIKSMGQFFASVICESNTLESYDPARPANERLVVYETLREKLVSFSLSEDDFKFSTRSNRFFANWYFSKICLQADNRCGQKYSEQKVRDFIIDMSIIAGNYDAYKKKYGR